MPPRPCAAREALTGQGGQVLRADEHVEQTGTVAPGPRSSSQPRSRSTGWAPRSGASEEPLVHPLASSCSLPMRIFVPMHPASPTARPPCIPEERGLSSGAAALDEHLTALQPGAWPGNTAGAAGLLPWGGARMGAASGAAEILDEELQTLQVRATPHWLFRGCLRRDFTTVWPLLCRTASRKMEVDAGSTFGCFCCCIVAD